jgi:hypothetical protein
LLTAVPDVSGEIFRGWCPAVVPLLHAGRDTTEADTHRRFLRGCIFGPGCKSRRLHYLTSLGGAPCHSPHPCAWRAVAHRAKAGARGRLRRLTLQPSLTLDSTRVSFGWQAGPRLRPQALPHFARWGPLSFPTSLRLARRSASREGGRSGPPSAATHSSRMRFIHSRLKFQTHHERRAARARATSSATRSRPTS